MAITVSGTTVTYNDSSTQATAYTGARMQTFGASGTFTVPAGVTAVNVIVYGAGGGGRGGNGFGGAGGGRGAVAYAYVSGLTPGAGITVTVGSGGASGAAGPGTARRLGGPPGGCGRDPDPGGRPAARWRRAAARPGVGWRCPRACPQQTLLTATDSASNVRKLSQTTQGNARQCKQRADNARR